MIPRYVQKKNENGSIDKRDDDGEHMLTKSSAVAHMHSSRHLGSAGGEERSDSARHAERH